MARSLRVLLPGRRDLIVAVGTLASQVCSYALNIGVSRSTGTSAYGEFASLLTLVVVVGLPATALQQWAARTTARARQSDDPGDRASLARTTIAVSLGSALFAGLITALIAPQLGYPVGGASLAVTLAVLPLAWLSACEGVLLGCEKFARLAVCFTLAGLARLAALAALLLGDREPWHLVMWIGLASMVASVATVLLARSAVPPSTATARRSWRPGTRQVLRIVTVTGGLWALGNIDVVLARASLGHDQAGMYAAGALVARGVQWAPQFLIVAAFARFTDPAHSRAALQECLTKVVALGTAAVLVLALVGAWIVPLVLGADFRHTGSLAWQFAVLGTALAVNQCLVTHRIATGDERAAYLVWIGFVALVVLGLLPGASLERLLGLCIVLEVGLAAMLLHRAGRLTPRVDAGAGSEPATT